MKNLILLDLYYSQEELTERISLWHEAINNVPSGLAYVICEEYDENSNHLTTHKM